MNAADPGRETRIVLVHGRNIVIRKLVDAQMMLLARESKILQRDDVEGSRKLESVDRMFRILQTAIVQPEDREYLEDMIVEGEVDLSELISFVTVFTKTEDGEDIKPKVRRGRPPVKRS